jgi:hypothetical protein
VQQSSEPAIKSEDEVSVTEKRTVSWLTNASDSVNHVQNGIVSVMYVEVMMEFDIDYVPLVILVAVRTAICSILQGAFGLVTPFVRKIRLMAVGNLLTDMLLLSFLEEQPRARA